MSKIKIYNQQGETTMDYELDPKVFDIEVNEGLVHQAVVAQMANQRQVLAHTKGRSEVKGGGKKPWRQKGTGRARAGSSRSPIWIGGGVTFGPTKERNFSKSLPIKMKRKALTMVLSDKVRNQAMAVLEKIDLKEAKTKESDKLVKIIENKILIREGQNKDKADKRNMLVLIEKKDDNITRSLKNLVGVEVKRIENINIVGLLKYHDLVLTLDGVKELEKIYGQKNKKI